MPGDQQHDRSDSGHQEAPEVQARGADCAGDSIPPDQTLIFTVTLAKVEYAP